MSNDAKNVSVQVGPGALGFLGLLFVVLKVLGYITWSWLWVLAPFWIPLAITLVVLFVILIIAIIAAFLGR